MATVIRKTSSLQLACGSRTRPGAVSLRGLGLFQLVVMLALTGCLLLAGLWFAGHLGPGGETRLGRMFGKRVSMEPGGLAGQDTRTQAMPRMDTGKTVTINGLSIHDIISRLLDKNRLFSERCSYARTLAELKTPAACKAMIDAFQLEKGANRRVLAQLMADTHEPGFRESLMALLETGDDADASVGIRGLAAIGGEPDFKRIVAIMGDDGWPDTLRTEAALQLLKTGTEAHTLLAVRGMGEIGGDDNADRLAEITHAPDRSETLRFEAALGLGQIGSTRAGEALAAALSEFPDSEMQQELLDSLGHFPFTPLENSWKQLLASPDTPDEVRSAAAEALANSTHEAVPFLQALAASDHDTDVREMAAWAISAHGPDGTLGAVLADMVRAEPEVDVRRRLYEAMMAQAQNPAATLVPTIQAERNTAARVAGFNALSDAVRRGQSSSLALDFDAQIVPELTRIALAQDSINIRMRAVFALRRAGTPASLEALTEISKAQSPQIAQAAINGLKTSTEEP
jgi:HEAT repeat protein